MAIAPTPDERSGPVTPSDRIDSIDALRGLALLGVLAINLVTEFRVSMFEQFLPGRQATAPLDRAVETVLMLAVDMKAFAVFSLLFGVGLAIQFEHLSASPRRAVLLFRRLIALLTFGLIHMCLIWNGDILTEYAVAGLVVLPFLFGPRWLLVVGAAVFIGVYLAMQVWSPAGLFPSFTSIQGDVEDANRIYRMGGLGEVSAFRLREIPLILPLHVYVFPRTVGLFLFGAFAWRSGVLRMPHQVLLFSTAAACIGLGACLVIAGSSLSFAAVGTIKLAGPVGTLVLALGYSATILGLANLPAGKALRGWAAPLGRMAFTNYLAQSLVFGWIFYGYGLGLFGSIGASNALAIGLAVYIAQVFFSRWWLARYRYGPVEWLWRTLMYGTLQPMSLAPLTRAI